MVHFIQYIYNNGVRSMTPGLLLLRLTLVSNGFTTMCDDPTTFQLPATEPPDRQHVSGPGDT